jgi:hypothetical protein
MYTVQEVDGHPVSYQCYLNLPVAPLKANSDDTDIMWLYFDASNEEDRLQDCENYKTTLAATVLTQCAVLVLHLHSVWTEFMVRVRGTVRVKVLLSVCGAYIWAVEF